MWSRSEPNLATNDLPVINPNCFSLFMFMRTSARTRQLFKVLAVSRKDAGLLEQEWNYTDMTPSQPYYFYGCCCRSYYWLPRAVSAQFLPDFLSPKAPPPLLPLLPPVLLPLLFLKVHETGAANRRSEGISS